MLVGIAEERGLHPVGQYDHQDRCPSIEIGHHPKLLRDHYLDIDERQ